MLDSNQLCTKYSQYITASWHTMSLEESSRGCHFSVICDDMLITQGAFSGWVFWVGDHSHKVLRTLDGWETMVECIVPELFPADALSNLV